MAQTFDKHAAIRKMYAKARDAKTIEQEYANKSAEVGDTYFSMELSRAKLRKLSLEQAELKTEFEAAKARELAEKEDESPAKVVEAEIVEHAPV